MLYIIQIQPGTYFSGSGLVISKLNALQFPSKRSAQIFLEDMQVRYGKEPLAKVIESPL